MAFHKVCELCGESFVSVWRKAKYCSRTCSNRVHGASRRIETIPQMKEYFFAHLQNNIQEDENVCWEWQGITTDFGYGIAHVKSKNMPAHRLSYILFISPIPDGLFVLHDPVLCNNPPCVNPNHLRIGTKQDNAQDSIIAGTKIIGVHHHSAKFTDDDVRAIRQQYAQGQSSMEDIADDRHVGFLTIRNMIRADGWKHVDPDTYVPPPLRVDKLSPDDIRLIRSMRQQGMMLKDIARHFDNRVTLAHISSICRRKERANIA